MGASSVTGVGLGSAEGGLKGPGNGRDIYVPLLTPHVVAAGNVTCASNVATIVFPTPLPGAPTDYVVLLTTFGAAVKVATVTAKSGSTTFTGFAIVGTDAAQVVGWAIVTAGNL